MCEISHSVSTSTFTPTSRSPSLSISTPTSISIENVMDFPGGAVVENPPANAGDTGSSAGPGRFHTLQSN